MGSSKAAARKRRRQMTNKALKASAPPPDGPFSFQAAAQFDEESFEAKEGRESVPSFVLEAYNGGKMQPAGFRFPVVVDLAGIAHEDKTPIFLDHDVSGKGIVGHSKVKIDSGSIHAEGIVSGGTEAARSVVQSAKKGFPWQVSIGATIEDKRFVKSGDSKRINGGTYQGPFYHVVKSHLHEVSFVPIGADKTTSAAIAAQKRSQTMAADVKAPDDDQEELNAMDPELQKWIESQGFAAEELNEKQRETLELSYTTLKKQVIEDTKQSSPDEVVAQLRKTTSEEITRQAGVRSICKHNPQLAAQAVDEGWTTQRTELEELKSQLGRAPSSATPGVGAPKVDQNSIAAALCLQAGMDSSWLDKSHDHWKSTPGANQGFDEQTLDAATDLGQYSFSRLMHDFLYANGISVAPGLTTLELIPKVKNAHKTLAASTGFSTIDISGILSNVMGKSMLAMFDTVRPVAQRLSASRSVRDFKETKAFRLTGNGDFLPLGPTGELQSMQLQEEEYSNKPTTRGRMISVSREMLINDDLGALSGITRILGRKAALSLQKEFFTLFVSLEGSGFFAAGNNNLIDNPLGITGLTAGEQTYYDQVDADGDPIDIEAQTLLVPSALKVTAEELMQSSTTMVFERDAAGSTTTKAPVINPHAGKWNIEWSPWLNKLGEADQDTAWWLLAPPGILAAMEIVYINGRSSPYIESEDSDFSTLGFQWRSYFDFGIAQQDYRAAIKSDGTGT